MAVSMSCKVLPVLRWSVEKPHSLPQLMNLYLAQSTSVHEGSYHEKRNEEKSRRGRKFKGKTCES